MQIRPERDLPWRDMAVRLLLLGGANNLSVLPTLPAQRSHKNQKAYQRTFWAALRCIKCQALRPQMAAVPLVNSILLYLIRICSCAAAFAGDCLRPRAHGRKPQEACQVADRVYGVGVGEEGPGLRKHFQEKGIWLLGSEGGRSQKTSKAFLFSKHVGILDAQRTCCF